jgi:hypothetical protein
LSSLINVALPSLIIFFGVSGLLMDNDALMVAALVVSCAQLIWFIYWWKESW